MNEMLKNQFILCTTIQLPSLSIRPRHRPLPDFCLRIQTSRPTRRATRNPLSSASSTNPQKSVRDNVTPNPGQFCHPVPNPASILQTFSPAAPPSLRVLPGTFFHLRTPRQQEIRQQQQHNHKHNSHNPNTHRNKRPPKHIPRSNRNPRTRSLLTLRNQQNKTPRLNRPRISNLLQNGPQKRLPQLSRFPPPPQNPRSTQISPRLSSPNTQCTRATRPWQSSIPTRPSFSP